MRAIRLQIVNIIVEILTYGLCKFTFSLEYTYLQSYFEIWYKNYFTRNVKFVQCLSINQTKFSFQLIQIVLNTGHLYFRLDMALPYDIWRGRNLKQENIEQFLLKKKANTIYFLTRKCNDIEKCVKYNSQQYEPSVSMTIVVCLQLSH